MSILLNSLSLVAMVMTLSGCCSQDRVYSYSGLCIDPLILEIVNPNSPPYSAEYSGSAKFMVWVDVNPDYSIEEIGYKTRDAETDHYEATDMRRKIAIAGVLAINEWTFSPIIIDGQPFPVVLEFEFNVSISNGVTSWIITDEFETLLYDSEQGYIVPCPMFSGDGYGNIKRPEDV